MMDGSLKEMSHNVYLVNRQYVAHRGLLAVLDFVNALNCPTQNEFLFPTYIWFTTKGRENHCKFKECKAVVSITPKQRGVAIILLCERYRNKGNIQVIK